MFSHKYFLGADAKVQGDPTVPRDVSVISIFIKQTIDNLGTWGGLTKNCSQTTWMCGKSNH